MLIIIEKIILKMSRGGTDRQPTGIYAFSNEIITINVESDDDPLPSIRFSQYIREYMNWLSFPFELKKGKNILKAHIEVNIESGGPIYIENKYIPNEQSQNIKIYFEGGTLFQINDDENSFKDF